MSRWRPERIRLATYPPREVRGEVLDGGEMLAIRKEESNYSPRWKVIHVPTGTSIPARYPRKRDARDVAEAIAAYAGPEWRQGTFGEPPEGETKRAMLDAVQTVDFYPHIPRGSGDPPGYPPGP